MALARAVLEAVTANLVPATVAASLDIACAPPAVATVEVRHVARQSLSLCLPPQGIDDYLPQTTLFLYGTAPAPTATTTSIVAETDATSARHARGAPMDETVTAVVVIRTSAGGGAR